MANMSSEKREQFVPGLPGLSVVREYLGITVRDLAEIMQCSPKWISTIETVRDPSLALVRQIAGELACHPADLVGQPNDFRLAQIRAAYYKRQADEAARAVGG